MHRRHSAFVAVALGLTVATVASGCSGGTGRITLAEDQTATTDGGSDRPGGGALTWGSCQKYDIAVSADTESMMDDAGMACATLGFWIMSGWGVTTLEQPSATIPLVGPPRNLWPL